MEQDGKYAKVPEGMTIDKPKPEEKKKTKEQPLSIKDFSLDPDLPLIQNPHFTNNAQTEMACTLIRPDGMVMIERNIPADEKHPLFRDIMNQFTEAEIATNTKRQVAIQNAQNDARKQQEKDREREKIRQELWDTKSKFMEMDMVKNSSEKILKRNLRKATTPYEAMAFGVAILVKESDKQGE